MEKPPITRPSIPVQAVVESAVNGNKPKERDPRPGDPEFDSLSQGEQIRRSILASFLAEEHSLEALQTVQIHTRAITDQATALRELTATVGPLVLQVNALISDLRDERKARLESAADSEDSESTTPAALRSYSDLPFNTTEGGTQKFYATRDQLRQIAREEFKELGREEALKRDARPWRWVRGKLGPKVIFFILGGALAGVGTWLGTLIKALLSKH